MSMFDILDPRIRMGLRFQYRRHHQRDNERKKDHWLKFEEERIRNSQNIRKLNPKEKHGAREKNRQKLSCV